VDDQFLVTCPYCGEQVVSAVLAVLERRGSEGEINDVKQTLPAELRELWPAVSSQRV